MIYLNKSDLPLVHDLNRFPDSGHARPISSAEGKHELGSTRLCARHDLSASEGIQPDVSGQACSAQDQRLLLTRSGKRLGFKTPSEVFHQSLKYVALRT